MFSNEVCCNLIDWAEFGLSQKCYILQHDSLRCFNASTSFQETPLLNYSAHGFQGLEEARKNWHLSAAFCKRQKRANSSKANCFAPKKLLKMSCYFQERDYFFTVHINSKNMFMKGSYSEMWGGSCGHSYGSFLPSVFCIQIPMSA